MRSSAPSRSSSAAELGVVPETRGGEGLSEAATGTTPACDHRSMSDADPERNSFEDVARALADEVSRAVERLSEIDVDEIARAASAEADRARRWIDDLGGWLREQGDALGNAPFGAGEAWQHGRAPSDRSARAQPDRRGSAATRRAASARSPDGRPRAGARGTRLWPLEGRAGDECARCSRRGPRAQRRARARPRAAGPRLDDRRRRDHARRRQRAAAVARRRGSRLTTVRSF